MEKFSGILRPDISDLPQIEDRISFVYLECCQINRDNGALTVIDKRGTAYIPVNTFMVLMLGPGTTVTHRAMELIGDAGVSVVWVGDQGLKYYASGRPLSAKANFITKQAELFSNQRKHLAVVRKMYEMRFPNEDVSTLTLQQLRGREGTRVKAAYKEAAKKWNVEWNGRNYDHNDFSKSDPVNQALTVGNQCLYGVCHAIIAALGCSPGLGFVHVGHENSFVYDIADLYKADITIPLAFELVARKEKNLSSMVRHRMRDEIVSRHLLKTVVHDIQTLFDAKNLVEKDEIGLWNKSEVVSYGMQYGQSEANYGSSHTVSMS